MITLQYPWLLCLLPLPVLVYWLTPAANKSGQAIRIPFFTRITTSMSTRQSALRWQRKGLLLSLVWIGLVLASTNPLWLDEPIQIDQSGRDLMLAIDLSQSMELPDMQLNGRPVNRLIALKKVASDFIQQRRGDRLGIVLFGSKAYLQTPLTFDWQTVQYMLDDASIGLAGPRTAMGDAIGLSAKYLKDLPDSNRVLILLTDGANNSGYLDPMDAAKIAKDLGIKIYTIGLGSDKLAIRGFFGQEIVNPSEDLDETLLKNIADMTQGHYFRAKDTASLTSIYEWINQLEPLGHDAITLRPQTALYPWPLGFALLILLLRLLRQTHLSYQQNRVLREASP